MRNPTFTSRLAMNWMCTILHFLTELELIVEGQTRIEDERYD